MCTVGYYYVFEAHHQPLLGYSPASLPRLLPTTLLETYTSQLLERNENETAVML